MKLKFICLSRKVLALLIVFSMLSVSVRLDLSYALAPPSVSENHMMAGLAGISSEHMPAPHFPAAEDIDNGRWRPRWLYLEVLSQIILEGATSKGQDITFSFNFLKDSTFKRMADLGHNPFEREDFGMYFSNLVEHMVNIGLLRRTEKHDYQIAVSPRLLAVWASDIRYIVSDIRKRILTKDLIEVLADYDRICEIQYLYPVESMYPVLKAVTLLTRKEQRAFLKIIENSGADFFKRPLLNSIYLTLSDEGPMTDWVKNNTPNLEGVRIYELAAEISQRVGGLGSVEQYHGNALKQLGAEVIYFEPMYRLQKDLEDPSKWVKSDYSATAYPVEVEGEPGSHEVEFFSKKFNMRVHDGRNINDIQTLLLEDDANPFGYPFFNMIYSYNDDNDGTPSILRFSAFLAKAQWEYIRERERVLRKEQGEDWKPPVINTNDAQTLLVSVYRLIDYWAAISRGDTEEAKFLKSIMISATTHTYRNRGIVGDYSSMAGELVNCGIPEEFHWLFLRDVFGVTKVDITSAGLRAADFDKAVAAIHAKEVAPYDPGITLYGNTNGDNRPASAKYFRYFLNRGIAERDVKHDASFTLKDRDPDKINTGKVDPDNPVAEDVLSAKRKAKRVLGLDPDKKVFSYSGRWVYEKWGNRVFTHDNIRELVKNGAQVVIYATVFDGNTNGYDKLEEEIAVQEMKGRFIFKQGFTTEDQMLLLAATDVQIQDSERGTGACEYTESDASACGALSMGPPWQEGVINRHGVPVNFSALGWGNSIVPETDKPESYLKQLLKINSLSRGKLSENQASSVRLSRILTARNTAASYLRLWSAYYDVYKNRPLASSWENPFVGDCEIYSVETRVIEESAMADTGKTLVAHNNTFEQGTPVRIYVKINSNGRPVDAISVSLIRPDGNIDKMRLQAKTGDVLVYSVDMPKNISGEFQVMATSGFRPVFYRHKIMISRSDKEGYRVVREKIANATVLNLFFPEHYGGRFHCGFAGKGFDAWTRFPDSGIAFSNCKISALGKYEPGARNFIMETVENGGYIITVEITDPDITHLVFVTQTSAGRWHDAGRAGYWVEVDPPDTIPPAKPLQKILPAVLTEIPASQ